PLSVSPDGRWIAMARGAPNRGLNAISTESVIPQMLVADGVPVQPFWSPDSRSIAFFDDGKLKKSEISGGPSQTICDAAGPIGGGTWNSEGVILFSSGGVIYRVIAAGGQPTVITTLDQSKQETEHLAPYFLPDGHHYVFLSLADQPSNSAIYLGSLDSSERTRLFTSQSKAVYAAPGYLLFDREGTVFAQPFDEHKLALTGEPIRIAEGAYTGSGPNVSPNLRFARFAVSQTGVIAYVTGSYAPQGQRGNVADRSLIWMDRSGGRTGQLGGPAAYVGIDLSPDGKQVAVHLHEGSGGDSWFFDSAQDRMQRLTFDGTQDNSMPVWSPDGTRLAFSSKRNGKWGVYMKLADGTAKEELLTESDAAKTPMSWTPAAN